ncbi:MAG: hypothetical protein U9R25_04375 [Chloroflexota bacterium]|nr:hypothetical protein [Chloroflexota bacterium]
MGNAQDDGLHVSQAGADGVYADTTQSSHEWGFYTPDAMYAGSTLAFLRSFPALTCLPINHIITSLRNPA